MLSVRFHSWSLGQSVNTGFKEEWIFKSDKHPNFSYVNNLRWWELLNEILVIVQRKNAVYQNKFSFEFGLLSRKTHVFLLLKVLGETNLGKMLLSGFNNLLWK